MWLVVGSLLEVPLSAPGTPIHSHVRAPEVVCASGSPADFDRYGLGVTLAASVCPVVVVCTEGTLFSEWADTRTASFRALDHTGFITSAPFWNKNVWELPL